ncbi:MAG: 3-dehydroquinate synthase [Gemmatimonadaceae bacterium]|nr:3-dehydroquinate synthase [Gemmatimonadaceae bacterium]
MGHAPALTLPLDYPVYCHAGALLALGDIVEKAALAHRYAVITDDTVGDLYSHRVVERLPVGASRVFTIPAGEREKNRQRWGELTDALAQWGAGRDTTVIALGGGVIGDLAGFVAATFMRGIPVVQVPTTLLAMVDAAVGGKTAVDTPLGKNLVGSFHNPSAVIMDPDVLASLPPEQLRAGFAEMIKHGVVADASYFDAVRQAMPDVAAQGPHVPGFDDLIAGSVRIKAAVVAEDTREDGLRQILNFGHTIAHAIERELHFRIAHGEAVAIGMVMEARIAESIGLASPGLHTAIVDAVQTAGLPWALPVGLSADALLSATLGDKKARTGTVRYALPRGIGEMESAEGRWAVPISSEVVLEALRSG